MPGFTLFPGPEAWADQSRVIPLRPAGGERVGVRGGRPRPPAPHPVSARPRLPRLVEPGSGVISSDDLNNCVSDNVYIVSRGRLDGFPAISLPDPWQGKIFPCQITGKAMQSYDYKGLFEPFWSLAAIFPCFSRAARENAGSGPPPRVGGGPNVGLSCASGTAGASWRRPARSRR